MKNKSKTIRAEHSESQVLIDLKTAVVQAPFNLKELGKIEGYDEIDFRFKIEVKRKRGRPRKQPFRIIKFKAERKLVITNLPSLQAQKRSINHKSAKKRIAEAYAEFLNSYPLMEWDLFVTLTSHKYLTRDNARRHIQSFVNEFGSNINAIFFVIEKFTSGYGYHLHCLLSVKGEGARELLHGHWQSETEALKDGEHALTDFQPYDKCRGGAHYLTHKLVYQKDVDFDFFLGSTDSAITPPSSKAPVTFNRGNQLSTIK